MKRRRESPPRLGSPDSQTSHESSASGTVVIMGCPSKPNIGRDITEDLQSRIVSKRCMTCTHMVVSDTFVNNVNGRTYYVIAFWIVVVKMLFTSFLVINVGYIMLVKLARHSGAGFNHRNRIKQLCNLPLQLR